MKISHVNCTACDSANLTSDDFCTTCGGGLATAITPLRPFSVVQTITLTVVTVLFALPALIMPDFQDFSPPWLFAALLGANAYAGFVVSWFRATRDGEAGLAAAIASIIVGALTLIPHDGRIRAIELAGVCAVYFGIPAFIAASIIAARAAGKKLSRR
jgi:hypothetical protein